MELQSLKDFFNNREIKILGEENEYKRYAVAIPIYFDGNYKVLFEVRSHKLRFQPGDISFPGGKVEEGETPKEAAIRELIEETGLKEEQIELIGQFDTLVTYHGKIIYVFVVQLKEIDFNPSKDEVDELFFVPMEFFLNQQPKVAKATLKAFFEDEKQDSKGLLESKTPIYYFNYNNKTIWGITAKIIYYFVMEFLTKFNNKVIEHMENM